MKPTPQQSTLEFCKDLVEAYTLFRDQVYNSQSVLYPSCGFDASPSRVFRKVTFVDNERDNKGCIAALQREGLTVFQEDIRSYRPNKEHDLLILQNPGIPPRWAVNHVGAKGYVFTNNYHLTACWLNVQKNKFSLLGVMDYDSETGLVTFTRNGDERLSRTVSLESIAESREMEHLAFTTTPWIRGSGALPFERVAENYIFQRKK